MRYLYTPLFIASFFLTLSAWGFDHSHQDFDALLQKYVKVSADKTSSAVDYKNFDKGALEAYLKKVSAVSKKELKAFSNKEKLAFFINSYNAYTIKLILDNYPVKSIRDTGVRSFSNPLKNPWKMKFFSFLGKKTSLDEIEHKLTRGDNSLNQDPRIHFAFNCASIGCPALSNKAWMASSLEEQFDQAAKGFLSDRSRNKTNLSKKQVEVSDIFKWYGGDFKKGKYSSLEDFFASYADAITDNEDEKKLIQSKNFTVKPSGYDWNLNAVK